MFTSYTCGMNLNACINVCRLREMEALLVDSTYAGVCMMGLAVRVGLRA